MNSESINVIVVYRNLSTHIVSSLVEAALQVASIGIGVLIGSTVMQLIGAALFLIWLYSTATKIAIKSRCTIDEARDRLDEIERGWS